MSAVPPEPTNRLSELIRGLTVARTVKDAEAVIDRCLGHPEMTTPIVRPLPADRQPQNIGIWRRTLTERGVVYKRDRSLDDDSFWADVEEIGPKKSLRVVLIGESVAKGAYVDPLFNCASALSSSWVSS